MVSGGFGGLGENWSGTYEEGETNTRVLGYFLNNLLNFWLISRRAKRVLRMFQAYLQDQKLLVIGIQKRLKVTGSFTQDHRAV